MIGRKSPDKDRAKATKRLKNLDTGDVIAWADQVGTGVSRCLDDFRRTKDILAIEEARRGISMLHASLDVLETRALDPAGTTG